MRHMLIAAMLLAGASAFAEPITLGDLTLENPHILETPPNAPVAGGYVSITNTGTSDDRLVSAATAGDVAGDVQLHQMKMDEGVMRMSQVDDGIPIPAGETVLLERGGLHVMFMGLAEGLEEGDRVTTTLTFEVAGDIEVSFDVKARGGHAGTASDGHGSHGSDGSHAN